MDFSRFVPPVALIESACGTVVRFESDAGLGVLRSDAGTEFGFHATAIANGTRSTAIGARVTFRLWAANLGVIEATKLLALD